MLVVASDRISVFDVVLPDEIPDKGRVLTALSTFWFEQTASMWPNHLVSSDPTDFPETAGPEVAGRAMLVRAARPVRLECIARGYLFGSAWSEYEAAGTVGGRAPPGRAPPGRAAARADLHDDDQGRGRPRRAARPRPRRPRSSATTCTSRRATRRSPIYAHAAAHAESCGLILADTKLEFGIVDGQRLVIDELCTSDSSRYWSADEYAVGTSPPSFDKQFVRDHYLAHRVGPAAAGAAAAGGGDRRDTRRATSRRTRC